MINYIISNRYELISSATKALAHFIAKDASISGEYAYIFKYFKQKVNILKSCPEIGNIVALRYTYNNGFTLMIYNLVIKNKSSDKPTYKDLTTSLEQMEVHARKNKIKIINLAMTRVDIGLDGLDWDKVLKIITKIFEQSTITINIFVF